MLRLAASHPPLWRTPSSLQLGTEPGVRIDGVSDWQERLLDALTDGIPDAMLVPLARSFGATAAQAQEFTARLSTVLTREDPPALAVQVEVPATLAHAELVSLTAGWDAAALAHDGVSRWDCGVPQPGIPLIVVAHRLLDPRRASRLMRGDVTHVPIELAGDRVSVGPVVVPGRTACTSCLHAHRADEDPQWPLLAAQLLGREPVRTDPALLVEAALLAGRLLREAAALPAEPDGEVRPTLSLGLSAARARRSWRVHRPHERCLCRSPEGIATAAAAAPPSAGTSSGRATARPA